MRIKINDRVAPPVPLPAPGEVGVSAPPATLEQEGIRARGLVDPVTGVHLSAVDEEHSAMLVEAGFVPVLPSAYLVGAFGRAVTALAYRLIAIDRVENMLARFEQEFPVLVHAALARYTLTDLTRLLRELVRERVPIDDLWRILNALAMFDEVEGRTVPAEDRLAAALARVRLELADRVVLNSCGLAELEGASALVYETESDLEDRVEKWRRTAPADADLRAARVAVWNALARSGEPVEPVILTSPSARPLLRRALNFELPDVHVLARSEIPPGVTVERAGVITA
jgi:flagellar biosynthesis component FlhA